jgi:hypothetical protein
MFRFLSRLSAFILSVVLVLGFWAGIPTTAQAVKIAQPISFASLEGLANYPASVFELAEAATVDKPAVVDEAAKEAAKEAKAAAKAAEKEAKKVAKAEAKKLKLAAKAEEKKLKEAKEAEKDAAKADEKKLKLAAKEEAKKLKVAKEAEAEKETAKAMEPEEAVKAS